MKLSEFEKYLGDIKEINILQPDGKLIPSHFHITEAGLISRHFIDCGGTVRLNKTINFQVWVADDYSHRLEVQKLRKIISMARPLWGDEDLEVELEYQMESISRFGLDFDGSRFVLVAKHTDCPAQDTCGIPSEKRKIKLSELQTNAKGCCAPGESCS